MHCTNVTSWILGSLETISNGLIEYGYKAPYVFTGQLYIIWYSLWNFGIRIRRCYIWLSLQRRDWLQYMITNVIQITAFICFSIVIIFKLHFLSDLFCFCFVLFCFLFWFWFFCFVLFCFVLFLFLFLLLLLFFFCFCFFFVLIWFGFGFCFSTSRPYTILIWYVQLDIFMVNMASECWTRLSLL